MATAAIIREALFKAREYLEKKDRAAVDPDVDAPEFDMKCEALLPVLRRQVQAHFHATGRRYLHGHPALPRSSAWTM